MEGKEHLLLGVVKKDSGVFQKGGIGSREKKVLSV
jgi:hypothetical protein